MRRTLERLARHVWLAQAAYYLVTGVWAVVGIRSFQIISGPKTDIWLVRTVGLLVAVVGGSLGVAGWRRRITPEIIGMAISTGAALTVIDVVYTAKRRISPIYLLDACANTMLIVGWVTAVRCRLLPHDSEPDRRHRPSRYL